MSDSGRVAGDCRHGMSRQSCVECLNLEIEVLRAHEEGQQRELDKSNADYANQAERFREVQQDLLEAKDFHAKELEISCKDTYLWQEEARKQDRRANNWEGKCISALHERDRARAAVTEERQRGEDAAVKLVKEELAKAEERHEKELAALCMPVGPVTVDETDSVYKAFTNCQIGQEMIMGSAAIDKLIAPRVAQAVAAEREKYGGLCHHSKTRDDCFICVVHQRNALVAERKLHAAELAKVEKIAENAIAAERDKWKGPRLEQATHQAVVAQMAERHAAELAKWKARSEANEKQYENLSDEFTNADQRWQERLKAVEADHKKELAVADSHKKMFAGLSEKLTETLKQVCESRSKAVSAAYEEAVKIADKINRKAISPGWGGGAEAVAKAIRQLAAKPQEKTAGPICENCHDSGQVLADCPDCTPKADNVSLVQQIKEDGERHAADLQSQFEKVRQLVDRYEKLALYSQYEVNQHSFCHLIHQIRELLPPQEPPAMQNYNPGKMYVGETNLPPSRETQLNAALDETIIVIQQLANDISGCPAAYHSQAECLVHQAKALELLRKFLRPGLVAKEAEKPITDCGCGHKLDDHRSNWCTLCGCSKYSQIKEAEKTQAPDAPAEKCHNCGFRMNGPFCTNPHCSKPANRPGDAAKLCRACNKNPCRHPMVVCDRCCQIQAGLPIMTEKICPVCNEELQALEGGCHPGDCKYARPEKVNWPSGQGNRLIIQCGNMQIEIKNTGS